MVPTRLKKIIAAKQPLRGGWFDRLSQQDQADLRWVKQHRQTTLAGFSDRDLLRFLHQEGVAKSVTYWAFYRWLRAD